MNPCCRDENPVSWTKLDDGVARNLVTQSARFERMRGFKIIAKMPAVSPESGLREQVQMSREGLEPSTHGLKGHCSTT